LKAAWGSVVGEEFYDKIRGAPQVERDGGDHSIGHSHVLPPDLRNDVDAYAVINRLTQKAAMRLRKAGYHARRLTATVKYLNAPSFHGETRFEETQDTMVLLSALDAAWGKRPQRKHLKLLQVGVTFHDLLTAEQVSGSLFAPAKSRDKLYETLDKLNVKFGKQAAYFGGSHAAMDHGKMAIAFNHIPDKDTEG
jgi:DNA polymerase IV